MKKNTGKSFLAIGIIFLIAGFVQQGFTFSFTSGMFTLGFIFTLAGLVSTKIETKPDQEKSSDDVE